MDLLAAGESTVYATGRLSNGTPIQASTNLTLIH
jgi:hypothetical protein